ncbi:MAG: TIGR02281 family clan AA aspartic protease [Gammaproteobacteria bacterium]|nr:TIGR02281 family clan AA aspartic protease [Gammaproteobacteria bacterium]
MAYPNDFATRLGRWMISLAWIGILVLLTILFSKFLENKREAQEQVVSQLSSVGDRQVILRSGASGHYLAKGKINRQPVRFLVDTGASYVTVPATVAARLGLKKGSEMQANTANGMITVYTTRLSSISLGEITLRNVRASINPYMQGEEILLGMSFLGQLSVNHERGRMTITQRSSDF